MISPIWWCTLGICCWSFCRGDLCVMSQHTRRFFLHQRALDWLGDSHELIVRRVTPSRKPNWSSESMWYNFRWPLILLARIFSRILFELCIKKDNRQIWFTDLRVEVVDYYSWSINDRFSGWITEIIVGRWPIGLNWKCH